MQNSEYARNSCVTLQTVEQDVQASTNMQFWSNPKSGLGRINEFRDVNIPLEQLRVLSVSTIPRTGFIARFAMPVLKFIDVMSKIAVPVVSEPVPAVVGTKIEL